MILQKVITVANQEQAAKKVATALGSIKGLKGFDEIEIYICDNKKKIRSNAYNAYYWGVVLKQISQFTGDSVQDLHHWYKSKFAVTFTTAFGETIETVKETSKMGRKEFDEYVQMIRQHAMNIGVGYIPEPNEVPDYVLIEQLNSGLV